MSYTKGPWTVKKAFGTQWVSSTEGADIAWGNEELPEQENLANIRLIAAAPKLLETIMQLRSYCNGLLRYEIDKAIEQATGVVKSPLEEYEPNPVITELVDALKHARYAIFELYGGSPDDYDPYRYYPKIDAAIQKAKGGE